MTADRTKPAIGSSTSHEKPKPKTHSDSELRKRTQQSLARVEDVAQVASEHVARAARLHRHEAFTVETLRLTRALERAYVDSPSLVSMFFRRFALVAPSTHADARVFLKREVASEKVRRVFQRYLKYAERYRVMFRVHKHAPHFRDPILLLPTGSTFSGRIHNGRLTPLKPEQRDISFEFRFSDRELRPFADLTNVAYMRLNDNELNSVLTDLESVMYEPVSIGFVVHHARTPYVWCLIGQDVRQKQWTAAYKAIKALLNTLHGRPKAGRRKDVQQLRNDLALRQGAGSLKAKAADAVRQSGTSGKYEDRAVYRTMERMSRAERLVRGTSTAAPSKRKSMRNSRKSV